MEQDQLQSVIHCPDCGGVVGATSTTEHGPPCRCFADRPKPKAPVSAPPDAPSNDPLPLADEADEAAAGRSDRSDAATRNGARADAPAPHPATLPTKKKPENADLDASAITEAPAEGKYCFMCGKNVAGHRRLKDSRGYRCLDCAKAEEAGKKPQGIACPKCHRVVKENSIGKHEGKRMCQRCLREVREALKPGSKKYRKIDDSNFEQANKTQLIVLISIAGLLALFMLIGWLSS